MHVCVNHDFYIEYFIVANCVLLYCILLPVCENIHTSGLGMHPIYTIFAKCSLEILPCASTMPYLEQEEIQHARTWFQITQVLVSMPLSFLKFSNSFAKWWLEDQIPFNIIWLLFGRDELFNSRLHSGERHLKSHIWCWLNQVQSIMETFDFHANKAGGNSAVDAAMFFLLKICK